MKINNCPHCKFIEETFDRIDNNYEYWLMIEVFVYLHNGKDYCNWQEVKNGRYKKLTKALIKKMARNASKYKRFSKHTVKSLRNEIKG